MKIHHIAITVNSLEESGKFYQDCFDFKPMKSYRVPELNAEFMRLVLDGFVLELWEFADMKQNSDDLGNIKVRGIRHIAFWVENINQIISNFREKGLSIADPQMGSGGHLYSFTSDPNGVALEINQV